MPWRWEDYFYPGTSVLKNKLDIRDGALLGDVEVILVNNRMDELLRHPVEGNFDYAHFQEIHRRLFQDVYVWAGQERTAPTGQFMIKAGHAYYPAGAELGRAARRLFRGLAQDDYLRGLEYAVFVDKLAEFWGELNVIHSFREGNTRTQMVFFAQLVGDAGYQLDYASVAQDAQLRRRFIAARFHGQDTGDNQPLAVVLREIIWP